MITRLILELRGRGVPVGLQEMKALAQALSMGLHESSLDRFYFISKAILIHDESHLDDFEQAFGFVFKGVPYRSKEIAGQLEDWLNEPRERPELSDEEKQTLKELNLEELMRLFEERLKEQTERHDGGSYWIGTGGRSPFGTQGYHPSGLSLGSGQPNISGGGRSMLRTSDARRYRSYRTDITLDVRQIEVALRKLRGFEREGLENELDLEKTIDATAKNFGELELVFRKPRRPNTRVILMMDVGGSMDPHSLLVSQVFSAAKRATHWKELRTYYFHNCIYGKVYRTDELREPISLRDLMRECDARYKVIFLGDASMAPYELLGWDDPSDRDASISALQWLALLRRHFPRSIWLNPDGSSSWRGGESTVKLIASVFPMYPLSVSGLEESLSHLKKR
ncbi:MAG: VWA domain-containing protein [Bdellovibrionota bacterium]